MGTLLIDGGTVVTQNHERELIHDGAVLVEDNRIAAVGPSEQLAQEHAPDRVIDATDHAIIPGLINPHTHISDILLRGRIGSDRDLYDWLFNVKQPGMAVMSPTDHELAAATYSEEALSAGVTTVVENDAEVPYGELEAMQSKFEVYDTAGIRNIYARGIRNRPTGPEFQSLIDRIAAKEPTVNHPDQSRYVEDLDRWFDELDSLYDEYHASADGRQEIWIAPVIIEGMTDEGLERSYQFAKERDIMTTIHTAEAPEQASGSLSPIEHLQNVNSLGEHALLGHCVHIDESDIRTLARTDTRVAHNIGSNLALGNGFAPVPAMRSHGVSVGLGTDNSILSDTVNPLSDLRLVTMAHQGNHRDPGVLMAQEALDMVTIEAARTIRKENELGSIEAGKLADIALVDLDQPQFTPMPNVISGLVYQSLGTEIDTVLCNGEVVVENGSVTGIDAAFPELRERATAAATRLRDDSGLADSRTI